MKILKISSDLEITEYDYPTGNDLEQNEFFSSLLGGLDCYYERVKPINLYSVFKYQRNVSKIKGKAISMLVDEDGHLKELPINLLASFLYGMNEHNNPILGDILLVGEYLTEEETIDFCGIDEEVLEKLKKDMERLISNIKKVAI